MKLFIVFLGILLALHTGLAIAQTQPPNVLFICIDDLRPELGCYGNELKHSPNLDKLSAKNRIFYTLTAGQKK